MPVDICLYCIVQLALLSQYRIPYARCMFCIPTQSRHYCIDQYGARPYVYPLQPCVSMDFLAACLSYELGFLHRRPAVTQPAYEKILKTLVVM